MAKYSVAIDQGTTSTRFMIFDHAGQVVALIKKNTNRSSPSQAGLNTTRMKSGPAHRKSSQAH